MDRLNHPSANRAAAIFSNFDLRQFSEWRRRFEKFFD
jgi:hypothetical protein